MIGEPLSEEAELETAAEFKAENFVDPGKPLAGKDGLDQAEKKGLIRKATDDDRKKWLIKYAESRYLPIDQIEEMIKNGSLKIKYPSAHAYVVLSPEFELPPGLGVVFDDDNVYMPPDFIVPENIPPLKWPEELYLQTFYFSKDGACMELSGFNGCRRPF